MGDYAVINSLITTGCFGQFMPLSWYRLYLSENATLFIQGINMPFKIHTKFLCWEFISF